MSGREEGIMTPNVRKVISSVVIVSFIFLPGALSAQGKRGVDLIVTPKDGSSVAGELIAVRQNTLLLLSPVGKDESVALAEVLSIRIVKKSKAGTGFLIGFLVCGIAGGVLGSQFNKGDEGYEGAAILPGVLLFGALGGLIGLGIGAASGGDETIEFAGLSEAEAHKVLDRLRGMARMKNAL
jgi:hypothetical protein